MAEQRPHAVFRYAVIIYDKIYDKSKIVPPSELVEYGYPPNDNRPVRVFIGHVTKEAREAGLSPSANGAGMRTLHTMDCVTRLRTGSGGIPSVYILHYKPSEDQYKEWLESRGKTIRRINPSKYDMLINDLERIRVELKDMKQRLAKLEETGEYAGHNL